MDTAARDSFVASYEQLARELSDQPDWLKSLRAGALASFRAAGLPSTKDEQWRYTNLGSLAKIPFKRSNGAGLQRIREGVDAFRLADCDVHVWVDGRYVTELCSSPGGSGKVRIASLAATIRANDATLQPHLARPSAHQDALAALNTALMVDGAYVLVPERAVSMRPMQLLFISTAHHKPEATHIRNLIVLERGAHATVIETYVGSDNQPYLSNPVTDIVLGEDAHVDHYKAQLDGSQAFHLATQRVEQGRSSSFRSHFFSLGGALVRNEIDVRLGAAGCECLLNGLFLARDQQHVDNHTMIEHAEPHCSSSELYKGVLDQHGYGVFDGKIRVSPHAQKTDAKQSSVNLLLSPHATVNAKPQLEIFADDVKCTHGATIGQLDRDALFYLRSRGVDSAVARTLLTYAFASEMVDKVAVEPLRRWLASAVRARLPGGSLIESAP